MPLGRGLPLLLVAVVGFAGGLDERQRLLELRLFPVPLVLQNVTVTKALGEIGAVVQHGYALFGAELRLNNGQEPTVNIDLPAGSTLGDALRQILKRLPGYDYEIVSAHLINIYPKGAKQDPGDLLNMRVAQFDVADTTPGEVISAPALFVPALRQLLYPGSGFLGGLSGGPRNLNLHLQNVTVREILNAASQATESFPSDLAPLGWLYTFHPKAGLPGGGVHSWQPLMTAPRDWKVPAKQG
jgi:hypothetical protein